MGAPNSALHRRPEPHSFAVAQNFPTPAELPTSVGETQAAAASAGAAARDGASGIGARCGADGGRVRAPHRWWWWRSTSDGAGAVSPLVLHVSLGSGSVRVAFVGAAAPREGGKRESRHDEQERTRRRRTVHEEPPSAATRQCSRRSSSAGRLHTGRKRGENGDRAASPAFAGTGRFPGFGTREDPRRGPGRPRLTLVSPGRARSANAWAAGPTFGIKYETMTGDLDDELRTISEPMDDPSGPAPLFVLRVTAGKDNGKSKILDWNATPRVLVGQSRVSDLVLDDARVSRRHPGLRARWTHGPRHRFSAPPTAPASAACASSTRGSKGARASRSAAPPCAWCAPARCPRGRRHAESSAACLGRSHEIAAG